MKSVATGIIMLGVSLGFLPAHSAALIPVIPPSGSVGNDIYGINDNNIIVGYYDDDVGSFTHGFFGTLDGNYTTFNYFGFPTLGTGINNLGQIVGVVANDGGCSDDELERFPNGKVKVIENGTAVLTGFLTGINNKGEFVGSYCDSNGEYLGYIGKSAKYRKDVSIDIANSGVYPRGINLSHLIVGSYRDATGSTYHGFFLHAGHATTVDYPNNSAVNTHLSAVNDSGMAVGSWDNGDFNGHAFMVDVSTNVFKAIKVPGATYSYANGINNTGLIAISSDVGSFIYCPGKKKDCPKDGIELPD